MMELILPYTCQSILQELSWVLCFDHKFLDQEIFVESLENW